MRAQDVLLRRQARRDRGPQPPGRLRGRVLRHRAVQLGHGRRLPAGGRPLPVHLRQGVPRHTQRDVQLRPGQPPAAVRPGRDSLRPHRAGGGGARVRLRGAAKRASCSTISINKGVLNTFSTLLQEEEARDGMVSGRGSDRGRGRRHAPPLQQRPWGGHGSVRLRGFQLMRPKLVSK